MHDSSKKNKPAEKLFLDGIAKRLNITVGTPVFKGRSMKHESFAKRLRYNLPGRSVARVCRWHSSLMMPGTFCFALQSLFFSLYNIFFQYVFLVWPQAFGQAWPQEKVHKPDGKRQSNIAACYLLLFKCSIK